MVENKPKSTSQAVYITLGAIAFLIILIATVSCGGKKKTTQQPTQPAKTEVKKEISYEIIKKWNIPNGGEGKEILISPDYLNEADMTALGQKVKEDNKDERNSFIWVFTDKRAAAMRDKVLGDELSETDRDFYDKHYVGQYTKNANSGFHKFTIYFDGVMGQNQKAIDYSK